VDYTSMKEKLLQSWRYKTSVVIKRHKTHFIFIFKSQLWLKLMQALIFPFRITTITCCGVW